MSSKIRDALLKADVLVSIATFDEDVNMDEVAKIKSEIKSALDKPLRNCEVGTAEEQTERFKQLCRKYRRGPGPRTNCKGCPVSSESQHVGCTFAWAQMPYDEGKNNEQ